MATQVDELSPWVDKGGVLKEAEGVYAHGAESVGDILTSNLGKNALILKQIALGDFRFFYVGRESLTAEIYGEDFRVGSIGTRGVPQTALRQKLELHYQKSVWRKQPILGRITANVGDNWVQYQRLIQPLQDGHLAVWLHPERIFHVRS